MLAHEVIGLVQAERPRIGRARKIALEGIHRVTLAIQERYIRVHPCSIPQQPHIAYTSNPHLESRTTTTSHILNYSRPLDSNMPGITTFPAFPENVSTHPLLIIDYELIKAGDVSETDKFWKAATTLGFW